MHHSIFFVSVGDGNIISGIHKGFIDLQRLGWLPVMPRIFGVQSELSNAVYQAWQRGDEDIQPVQATTFADSISVDLPRDGVRAVGLQPKPVELIFRLKKTLFMMGFLL